MNHLYKSILLCMSLCAATTAPAQVFIGDTEYTTLSEALTAAVDNDVITIKRSIAIGATIGVDAKTLTVRGDGDGIVITQADASKSIVSLKNSGSLTLENLTFEGNPESDATPGANHIYCPKGSTLNLNHVAFHGFKVSVANGFMRVLADCTVSLTDVSISGNIYAENSPAWDINIVNAGSTVTMAGKCAFNININNNATLPFDGKNLAADSRIGVYCSKGSGTEIISGTSDMQLATLLDADDRIIAPKIDGETRALQILKKPAVLNATDGSTYSTINAANNNAASGSRIIVYTDQSLTTYLGGNSKTLSFEAATTGITLTRAADRLIVNNGKAADGVDPTCISLKGFVIDGSQQTEQTSYLIDVRMDGSVELHDITFSRVMHAEKDTELHTSLVRCGAGSLLLDNVKFEDCTVDDGYSYVIANTGSACAVTGDCNFSVQISKGVSLAADGLSGVIDLNVLSPEAGAQVVTGCDDTDRFRLTNDGWMLTATDGGLSLAEAPLTIADPTVTGDGDSKHYAGTDLIYIPAGAEATVTFDIPAGATLEYYFEPRNFPPGVRRAAAVPEWQEYPADGIKVSETGWLHLRMTRGSQSAERSMYVFDEAALTGIDGITTDGTPARYYDMRGIEVSADALCPGIYIERRGAATRRIIVR